MCFRVLFKLKGDIMKKYTLKDPVFYREILLCVGMNKKHINNAIKEMCEDHEFLNEVGMIEDDEHGKFIPFPECLLVWLESLDTIEDIAILNHELIHATFYILDKAGVPIIAENDEIVAYHHQMLFNQVMGKLKIEVCKQKKRRKK